MLTLLFLVFSIWSINPVNNSFGFYLKSTLFCTATLIFFLIFILLETKEVNPILRIITYSICIIPIIGVLLLPIENIALETPKWLVLVFIVPIHFALLAKYQLFSKAKKIEKLIQLILLCSLIATFVFVIRM
jgi:hypothetical protein